MAPTPSCSRAAASTRRYGAGRSAVFWSRGGRPDCGQMTDSLVRAHPVNGVIGSTLALGVDVGRCNLLISAQILTGSADSRRKEHGFRLYCALLGPGGG